MAEPPFSAKRAVCRPRICQGSKAALSGLPGKGPDDPLGHLDPGVPKGHQMVKSRKLVFPVCFAHSAQNGHKGRVGPPESDGMARKAGKAGKHGKQRF